MALKRPDIDARDLHIYGGLLIAGVGGWQISPGWACVGVGLALTLFGLLAPRLGGGE